MNTKPKIYTEFTAFKTTKEVKELFLKANSINKELFTEQLKNLCLEIINSVDEVKPHELNTTEEVKPHRHRHNELSPELLELIEQVNNED